MKLYVKRAVIITAVLTAAVLRTSAAAQAASIPDEVVPLGIISGIDMETDGAMVTGYTDEASPAKRCGIHPGDIIVKVGDKKIACGSDLRYACATMGDAPVAVTVFRGEDELQLELLPRQGDSGKWELGITVRDGLSGIGTITFYDPETGIFGALGHGVTDVNSGAQIPIRTGSITRSVITGVVRGIAGMPGRIMGMSDSSGARGSVDVNTPFGIFGIAEDASFCQGELMEIAAADEVERGSAYILSDIDEEGVKRYDIEIVKVYGDTPDGRNMSIRVTDETLIDITGGIVQGMSGSPIIQNGKLVGAVTHVLVNDPTCGYGILIGNMLEAAA